MNPHATARLHALEAVARAAAAYVRISDARQSFAVWSAARADLRVSLNCLAEFMESVNTEDKNDRQILRRCAYHTGHHVFDLPVFECVLTALPIVPRRGPITERLDEAHEAAEMVAREALRR